MPYNPGQREAALLLAAKLSYEAGYTDEALDQVHTLLVDYPSSEFRGEAATLRSDLLSRSGDFAGALESLDGAAPGTDYNRIYQRAAYGLALERLLVNDVSAADSLLTRSLGRPQNPAYVAAAQFWKGETAYRLGHFEESLNALKSFRSETSNLQLRGVAPDATASAAALTMGYAAMALKDYVAAQRYFSEAKKGGGSLMASAALGEADAVLMQRQFSQAQALYEQAGSSDDRESDYAKMQRAILLGVQGKNTEKATLLQTLINRTPASAYESDARYELALARIADNRFAEAITLLQPLTSNRAYGPKALLRTGFAESEQNHDDAAIAAYRRVLSDFSGSTERSAALDALRAIYTERGTPEVYAGLLDQYGLADAGLDSAFYAAAEGRFAAGRYNDAIKGFNEYLTRYANGSFAPRAHYYVAASYDKIRDTTNALRSFDAVLSDLASEFTGLAASRAAILSESRGDTTAASTYYLALRNSGNQVSTVQTAFLGLARTSLALGRADAANAYADSLLSLPNLPEAVVNAGTLIQGNAASLLGNQDKAIASWGRIASVKQTYLAAEAGYKMAAAMYSQGRVADAEKAADHVVRLSGAPESWTVRSYLLLARIFADQKDFFNAKATLQSVVKNAKNPDLKAEAALQLEQVIQAEKGNSKLSAE
jgi:TolA-binding protein